MGLHIPPKSTLHGFPVSDIQKVVRKYGVYHQPDHKETYVWTISDVSHPILMMLRGAGMAVPCPDARNHGHGIALDLTDEGEAIMRARIRKRTPLAKVDVAWAGIQQGIDALNQTNLIEADEVWLFGSYMRRATNVGDIDAVIFTRWVSPDYYALTDGVKKAFADQPWLHRAIARQYGPGRTPGEEMTHQLIFGGRKKPIYDGISLTSQQSGICFSNLSAGMPTQRVYSRAKGWYAEDPIDRHPSAGKPLNEPRLKLTIDQGTFSEVNDSPDTGPLKGPCSFLSG